MASFIQGGPHGSGGVAWVVVCWMAIISAEAQTRSPAPNPIVLDNRTASRLILTQVKPEYPPLAKHNYIQGQVRMQVMVTREGRVREVHVVHGHPFLAASALKAVRRWLYRPFRTGSEPAEFLTVVEVNFALHIKNIEQLPRQPERDLNRQVRPAEILEKPAALAPTATVRLRVLVSDEGRVIDSNPVAGFASYFDAARKNVERWKFKPARWGTLPVPWYLDVDVPVETGPPSGARAIPAPEEADQHSRLTQQELLPRASQPGVGDPGERKR